jgi:hypothetical protein
MEFEKFKNQKLWKNKTQKIDRVYKLFLFPDKCVLEFPLEPPGKSRTQKRRKSKRQIIFST